MAGIFDDDDIGPDEEDFSFDIEPRDTSGIDSRNDLGHDNNAESRKMIIPVIIMAIVVLVIGFLLYSVVQGKKSNKPLVQVNTGNVSSSLNDNINSAVDEPVIEEPVKEEPLIEKTVIDENIAKEPIIKNTSQSETINNGYNAWEEVNKSDYEGKAVYYKTENVIVWGVKYYVLAEEFEGIASTNLKSIMSITKEDTGEKYSIEVPYDKAHKIKTGTKIGVQFGYIDIKDKRILVEVKY